MSDDVFGDINQTLKAGGAHPPGTNLGVTQSGTELKVRALVNRLRSDGRNWEDSLDFPLPAHIEG